MKLNKKERELISKANASLQDTRTSYASETHRADKWSRANVYRNRKAYTRKEKHKKDFS